MQLQLPALGREGVIAPLTASHRACMGVAQAKHLSAMHDRNPLSDKGMKLMHGIGDKYAKLLEKFQKLQVCGTA